MRRISTMPKLLILLPIISITILFCGLEKLSSQNKKADDFVLYKIDGTRTVFYDHIRSLPKNGVLLVNFTSIYCKPCRNEIPELVKITGQAPGRAKIIFIFAESGNLVKELSSELNILDKTYVDSFGNIQKQYDIKKIPVTYVIGKNNTILGRFEGYTDENIKNIESIVLVK